MANTLSVPLRGTSPPEGESKIILAIETSCDETAAAVLEMRDDKKLARRSFSEGGFPQITTLSSVVKSQIKLHSKFGGVVPEVAARAHVKNILPAVQQTINNSQLTIDAIDYVAVTAGPGLIPSLIVGVEFAKALSYAAQKPLIAVNHMAGHLYSPLGKLPVRRSLGEGGGNKEIKKLFPMISLIVSGGHTMIVLMQNIRDYQVLGETVDDAAGEAFDKVAKLLNLPYPGGPEVSKFAIKAKHPVDFPRPMINSKDYNFSFSGLKTSVLYYLRDHPQTKPADVCAGFEQAAIDVLVTKTMKAAAQYRAKSVSLSGGVAANKRLRDELKVKCQRSNVAFFVPPMNLCTDNAEMIGLAAAFMLHNGYKPKSYKQLKADPNLQL